MFESSSLRFGVVSLAESCFRRKPTAAVKRETAGLRLFETANHRGAMRRCWTDLIYRLRNQVKARNTIAPAAARKTRSPPSPLDEPLENGHTDIGFAAAAETFTIEG